MIGIQIVSFKDEEIFNDEMRLLEFMKNQNQLTNKGFLAEYLSFSDRIEGTRYYRIDRETNELTSWVKHLES